MSRSRTAWVVSALVHACLIAFLFAILHHLRSSNEDDPKIDTRIREVDDAAEFCLHWDEPTTSPPIVRPKTSQPIAAVEPPTRKESPAPKLEPTASSTAIIGATRPGSAPLHGKLSRAGYIVVYVLDHSGSMGQAGKLNKAREHLKASLRQLTASVRFQIVVYDRTAEVLRLDTGIEPGLATAENIARAEEQLDRLLAEGSSRHVEGLQAGLRPRPNLLILLSDADDLSEADAQRVKQWNAKQQTIIHAVILGSPSSDGGGVHALRDVCHQGTAIHFVP